MIVVTTAGYGEGVQFIVDRGSEHEFDGVPDGPFTRYGGEFHFKSRMVRDDGKVTLHDQRPNLHSSFIVAVHRTGEDRHGPWCFNNDR